MPEIITAYKKGSVITVDNSISVFAHLYRANKNYHAKVILRLMKEQQLLVKAHSLLKANRTPPKRKPKPDKPNQWWGIDMTKVMVTGFGWMYIVVVLDW
ncbi:MAG: hypothetical protein FWD30_04105 [Dehalococcoidia bacterium]|nr:hypothetical protein [Dehalococcoidia bacterium]